MCTGLIALKNINTPLRYVGCVAYRISILLGHSQSSLTVCLGNSRFSKEINEDLHSCTIWWPVIHRNKNLCNLKERKPLNIEFLFFSNPEPKNKSFIKCEAKNYSGHFTCWWLTAISTDLKFSVQSSTG